MATGIISSIVMSPKRQTLHSRRDSPFTIDIGTSISDTERKRREVAVN